MAKRKSTKLPPLTPRGRELAAYILNSVAFGTHDDECELEAMAKKLGMQPGRLRTSLSKLADQGYVTIEGTSAEWVYPTVATLRRQNPELDEAEATKIIRQLRR